jgi:rod shape determining protein RodA
MSLRATSRLTPRRPLSLRGFRSDPWLLVAVIGLCAASLITIKGATLNDIPGKPYFYVERQCVYIVLGLILMFAISRLDYRIFQKYKYATYGILIGSIALVFLFAAATNGSRRWLELPLMNFQPSELGKILLVLALSAFIVDYLRRGSGAKLTLRIIGLGLIPVILVRLQPDLGTALIYIVGILALLFFAGIPWRQLAAIGAIGVFLAALVLFIAPAAGIQLVEPYQKARLTSFLHPSSSPGSEGYQQQQSKIAIGSGEKTGQGEAGATQTALNFLPERHTDFIFGVIGETYGFAGASLVLSLYALLIWRSLRILTLTKNLFGALIVGGLTVMTLYQIFVNVGMTLGIMPITGITAPLLSFGGTSMLVTLMGIGLLQSVHYRSRDQIAWSQGSK